MSYILDALRRADSERERERGSVPGLHTQPVPMMSADDAPARHNQRWLVAGVTVLVLTVLGWLLLGRESLPADGVAAAPAVPSTAVGVAASATTAPVPVPVPAAPVAAVPAVLAPPVVVAAAAAASLPALPPIKVLPPPATVPAARRAAAASTPSGPASAPAVARAPAKPAAKVLPAAGALASSAAPAAASAPEGRIYTLAELPDDVRRDLPPLVIGGAMYSENPANRMLIVNGQLFHEGDKLAPGLSLEQIKLKSAVLRLKGYRYGISY